MVTGSEVAPDEARYCVNHPAVETVVSCGRCDTPLCPRCMIFTPVGVRCRDCAQLRRPPQYTLPPRLYLRLVPGALALALVVGFLLSLVPAITFLGGIVVGLAIGYGLQRLSGYKQGREIQIIAALAVIVAVLSSPVFAIVRRFGLAELGPAIVVALSPQELVVNIITIAIGIYLAVTRLR